MRCVVWTGSRGWQDTATVLAAVESLKRPFRSILGGADGFDTVVEKVVAKMGMPRHKFVPKWKVDGVYHANAGHVRNELMLKWGLFLDPGCICIAGWDRESSGTEGCIKKAEKLGIDVWRLQYVAALNGG